MAIKQMDKITRREFKGNKLWVVLLCLTVIENTIDIEYEVDDAEAFLEYHFGKK